MIQTSDASIIVCGHCGGLVKGSCCWMAGKAYHNSCYSLLMGVERGLASAIDKDARIAALEAERDQLRDPDCRTCKRHYVSANGEHKCGSVLFCRDGDAYDAYKPVRLYQEEGDDGNA